MIRLGGLTLGYGSHIVALLSVTLYLVHFMASCPGFDPPVLYCDYQMLKYLILFRVYWWSDPTDSANCSILGNHGDRNGAHLRP